MDLQEHIALMVSAMKQKEFATKPIRTLGEVILLLKAQPRGSIVKLDFCEWNPVGLCSYRGYYEDLSINYDLQANPMTVEELLNDCEDAVGKTFQGYKGGDFTMNTKTLVWVAQYGNCGRMLTDIKDNGINTIICTQPDSSED